MPTWRKQLNAVVLGRLARGNGQICCAVKRIFVEAPIFDQFAELLTEKAKSLKVGDQLQEDTDVGPLISEEAAKEVEAFINGAIQAGAKLKTGGKRRKCLHGANCINRCFGGHEDVQGRGIWTCGTARVLYIRRGRHSNGQ